MEEDSIADQTTAIARVLKSALAQDGLKRGLHEVAKAIESNRAKFCFLSKSCNEEQYTKLVKALCAEKKVPLFMVEDGESLGKWSGLCRFDPDGNPHNIVNTSCVCVTACEDTKADAFLQESINQGP
eukprot:Polyplicarium_translucidae@DN3265_c0_g2_i1.p8